MLFLINFRINFPFLLHTKKKPSRTLQFGGYVELINLKKLIPWQYEHSLLFLSAMFIVLSITLHIFDLSLNISWAFFSAITNGIVLIYNNSSVAHENTFDFYIFTFYPPTKINTLLTFILDFLRFSI